MARPEPIETTILLDIKSRLAKITKANGYNFNVGTSGVFEHEVDVGSTRQDTISVVRRTTDENYDEPGTVFGTVRYSMTLQIGFVHEYRGDKPQQRANLFISDIRRALNFEPIVSVTKLDDTTVNAFYVMRRIGSAINVTEAVPSRIHGQVDYFVQYETSIEDDRKVI